MTNRNREIQHPVHLTNRGRMLGKAAAGIAVFGLLAGGYHETKDLLDSGKEYTQEQLGEYGMTDPIRVPDGAGADTILSQVYAPGALTEVQRHALQEFITEQGKAGNEEHRQLDAGQTVTVPEIPGVELLPQDIAKK